MKLSYLANFSEDELKRAKSIGYDGIEASVRSWDLKTLESSEKQEEAAKEVRDLLEKYGLAITALAMYGMSANPPAERIAIYRKLGEFAAKMGVGVVSTISGGNPEKSLDENIPIFTETFKEVARIYEDLGVRLAFENWHGMTWFEFPMKSRNIGFHPETLEKMFDAVPSPALGIEYDATHMVIQGIDHIWVLKKFASRIYHLHLKDVEIDKEILAHEGMFKRAWFQWRIPGYGIIDWSEFISALAEIKYAGDAAIENEDEIFEFGEGIVQGYNKLRPMIPKSLF